MQDGSTFLVATRESERTEGMTECRTRRKDKRKEERTKDEMKKGITVVQKDKEMKKEERNEGWLINIERGVGGQVQQEEREKWKEER
jgi:hypothetical protein